MWLGFLLLALGWAYQSIYLVVFGVLAVIAGIFIRKSEEPPKTAPIQRWRKASPQRALDGVGNNYTRGRRVGFLVHLRDRHGRIATDTNDEFSAVDCASTLLNKHSKDPRLRLFYDRQDLKEAGREVGIWFSD